MSRGKTIVVLILFLALSACGLLAGGAWLVLRQAQPGPSPSSGQAPADAPETAAGASAAVSSAGSSVMAPSPVASPVPGVKIMEPLSKGSSSARLPSSVTM